MAKAIQRTALAEFKLGGRTVRSGEIVSVPDKRKLAEMVKAGCVEETDEADAALSKAAPQTDPDRNARIDKAKADLAAANILAAEKRAANEAIKAKADADVKVKAAAQAQADDAQTAADEAQAVLDALKA